MLRSRRELVANVSHELRTPVATMRAMLEATLDHWQDASSETLRHELEVMQGEVQRLQTLIDDLFALSQAQVAHGRLNCQPTDVAPIVQQMVDAVASLAWQSGRVHVVAELPDDLPQADVDGTRRLAEGVTTPVVASGGIARLQDVEGLATLPIAGMIIGGALYEGTIDLREAIDLVRRA